jgi:predicted RecB family nuclease
MSHGLSKSRFVSGLQCHGLLWWKVHEPDAPELQPDVAQQAVFDQGHEVGARACEQVPGGVLIDQEASFGDRLRQTQEALAAGAPVIYEASFSADRVFAAIDILERTPTGFNLIEVKSTTSVQDKHIPDAAVQIHVARQSGLEVERAELMHLNRECSYPDLDDLFVREDVTAAAEAFLPDIPSEIEAQLAMLDGPRPTTSIGAHCTQGYVCPFFDRCWPQTTPDHVRSLHRFSKARQAELIESGVESICALPPNETLSDLNRRQIRAARAGGRIIGRGLARDLEPFSGRIAHLDFETVSLAIPVWDGCAPWTQMPVQFSCHVEDDFGGWDHHEFLAEDGSDCRPAMAEALLAACELADSVVAYNAGFEKRCIRQLAEAVPERAEQLEDLAGRLVDPLPVIRNNIYDPAFLGSFSLKSVLPVLVPDLGYDDLEVAEGQTATVLLARLLFARETIPESEKADLRRHLLAYCERDTWATVRLLEELRSLARWAKEQPLSGAWS